MYRWCVSCLVLTGLVWQAPSADAFVSDTPQSELVGVYINGTALSTDEGERLLDVLSVSGEYYLSMADLADIIAITPTIRQVSDRQQYEFATPIGVATLAGEDIRTFVGEWAGVDYVPLSALKKLGIHATFSQSSLAIMLNMGYQAPNTKSAPTPAKYTIDHKPERFGLLSAYLDSDFQERHLANSKSSHIATSLGAFGYALGGAWGIDARHHAGDETPLGRLSLDDGTHTLNNAYWSSSGTRWATRLGLNQSSGGVLGDYTGVMFAYSNQGIERHLSSLSTHTTSLLQGQQNDLQTIKGTGISGGVAELRIEDRPVARVLVGLDGRYEFIGLDVGKLDNQTHFVEVAIYEYPQAPQPVRIERIFVGKRKTRVATGEYLLEVGTGLQGNQLNNWLNHKPVHHHWVGSVYGEYGLNNRLAIRASTGTTSDGSRSYGTHYVGANFVPAKYTNLDASYQHRPDGRTWQTDLTYQRPNLYASYHLNHHQQKSQYTSLNQSWQAYYRPNDTFGINISHSDHRYWGNKTDHHKQTQVSLDGKLSQTLSMGASWHSTGHHHWRLLWQDTDGTNQAGLQGDKNRLDVSLRHRLSHRSSLGMTISHHYGNPTLLYRGFISRQLTHGTMNVGYSLYGKQAGLEGQWQYSPTRGVQLSAGYRHRPVDTLSTNGDGLWHDKHYFYLKARFDWHKPHQKSPRLGAYPTQDKGVVFVSLTHPPEPAIESGDVRFGLQDLRANTPKKTVFATLLSTSDTASHYLIGNVAPSDYELTLEARNLPFEYQTDNLPKPTLRVAKYAPTAVSFALQSTFGVSGRLSDGKVGQMVGIWQGNDKIAQSLSDDEGYFQVFGLADGEYEVRVTGYHPKHIQIKGDVLMNVALEPME